MLAVIVLASGLAVMSVGFGVIWRAAVVLNAV